MCAVAIVSAVSFAAAEDKAAVREIPANDLKVNFGGGIGNSKVSKPAVITSAEELVKVKPLKDSVEVIKKQVDFSKEKLVFFFWGSLNSQQIVPDPDKPGTFTYTTRLSKSGGYKTYARVFVVPKDAEVKVTEKKE
jgi:hypothetical protein